MRREPGGPHRRKQGRGPHRSRLLLFQPKAIQVSATPHGPVLNRRRRCTHRSALPLERTTARLCACMLRTKTPRRRRCSGLFFLTSSPVESPVAPAIGSDAHVRGCARLLPVCLVVPGMVFGSTRSHDQPPRASCLCRPGPRPFDSLSGCPQSV
jgi:hypothetical protein